MVEARLLKKQRAIVEDKGKLLSYQLTREEASLEDWMIVVLNCLSMYLHRQKEYLFWCRTYCHGLSKFAKMFGFK